MKNKKAFTLVELLVVIAIIALLLAILVPALGGAKKQAQRIVCASDQKQILLAIETYACTYKGFYPTWSEGEWKGVDGTLMACGFIKSPGLFQCPSDDADFGPLDRPYTDAAGQVQTERNRKDYRTYGYNLSSYGWVCGAQGDGGWRKTGETKKPSTTIYISETPARTGLLYGNSYDVYVGPAPPNLKTTFGRKSGYSHWPGWDVYAASARKGFIHQKGCNYGFADGHAEYIVVDIEKEWPPFDWFDNGLYKHRTY